MKSTVENLSPTRVRLAVEVPFDDLKPSLDKAYKEISAQVRVCLLYTSPSPRDRTRSRMPSSA